MTGLNKSQTLVGAGASVSNDFANAQAAAGIDFAGAAQLKRGFKTEIGITAFTNASAGLSKFVAAGIEGTAFASARAGIQAQLALNLFQEFGLVVKAEAVAEAAAGVKANLGINIGDFINLALKDKNNIGLPVDLLIMFLEEVEIGGAFYIDVSFSAKAHFTFSLSGTLLPKPGQKPGFNFSTKAGAGLAKGVGMSFSAGIGFKDFRRFYGRAIDRSVNEVVNQINAALPSEANAVKPYLSAFAPIAKIGLRLSYDIGEKIIKNNIGKSAADAQSLCNECIKIILEEVQRFAFETFVENSLSTVKSNVISNLNRISDRIWKNCLHERHQLAALLSDFPDEAFQPSAENITYWKNLISKTILLAEKLFPQAGIDAKLVEQITVLYCASELCIEAIRAKVNTAGAFTVVAGIGTTAVNTKPFSGAPTVPPPQMVRMEINSKLQRAPGTAIQYTDLLEYLVDDIILDNVLHQIPALRTFVEIFQQDFNADKRALLKMLLNVTGAFIQNKNGLTVPKDTLKLLVKSLDSFLTDKFKGQVMSEVGKHLHDPLLKTYLEEVFLPCIVYTKDVALKAALEWESTPYTNDDFTEALAGVMMMFLGRTVVLMGDTLLTATQNEVQSVCNKIALDIENKSPAIAPLNPFLKDETVRQLVVDALRVGGEVLGPLPDETRSKIRMHLYQVFETIKPGAEEQFLEELQNPNFIPNLNDLELLCNEFVEIARYRFALFAEKILINIGNFILDSIEDLIVTLVDLVLNWEKHLADSLKHLANELKELDRKMLALNRVMLTQYQTLQTAYTELIAKLNSAQIKSLIKGELLNRFVSGADLILKNHPAYKLLPAQGKAAAVGVLRSTVDALLDNPILIPLFNSIDNLRNQLDGLMPDVHRFDPDENLAEQFLELLLDTIEDRIRRHYGTLNPSLEVSLRFSYTVPEVVLTPAVHIPEVVVTPAVHVPATPFSPAFTIPAVVTPATHIPAVVKPAETFHLEIVLGRVEMNLNLLLNLFRNAIRNTNFFHNKLNTFISRLGEWLAAQMESAAAELQRMDAGKRDNKLTKLLNELTSGAKEIKVLSPVQLGTYTGDVAVRIHLGAVPISYLGFDTDEVQRVHLFLNGETVSLKSMVLNTNADDPLLQTDFSLEALADFDADAGRFAGKQLHLTTHSATSFVSNTDFRNSNLNKNISGLLFGKVPFQGSIQASGSKGINGLLIVPQPEKSSSGMDIIRHDFLPVRVGKKLLTEDYKELIENGLPGFLLEYKIKAGDLVEGVNVLTVIVIDKGGVRHQQNVSFLLNQKAKPVAKGILKDVNTKKASIITLNSISKSKVKTAKAKQSFTTEIKGTKNRKAVKVNSFLPVNKKELAVKIEAAKKFAANQASLNLKNIIK